MSLKGEEALILGMDYTEESLLGAGALKGQDGVSPIISVNTSTADTYKLDITDKNGTITTPNLVGKQGERGEVGETGADGETPTITENADNTEEVYKLDFTTKNGTFTTKNIKGKQGLEGVSPTVTTSPDNTTEDYRLNITTKGGSFTTPNLRGPQGERGPIGESAVSAINPRGDYDVNAEPSYTKSDYITYTDGNTYVCKLDNPTNEPPIDGTVTDTYWQVIAFRGAQGIAGKDGEKGADGVTFTPSIDENGVLSFTNNGGLENPNPIDIKGDNGITFTPSIDADGYLSFTNNGNLENPEPIKVLGQDGVDGKDGIDGTTYIPSIGTVTTVESNTDASAGVTVDEETKEAVFHFELPKGEKGFSPIVETVESENGHTVNITDVDGVKSFDVFNRKDGVLIDDTTASENSVWSSKKTSNELAQKLNANNNVSMVGLGFTKGDTVHVSDFLGALVAKFGRSGYCNMLYANTSSATVINSAGTQSVLINGGVLYFSATNEKFPNDTWSYAEAIYYPIEGIQGKIYKFFARTAGVAGTVSNSGIYQYSSDIEIINDTVSDSTSTYSSAKIDEKIDGTTIKTTSTTGSEYYAITFKDKQFERGNNQGILIQHNRLNFEPVTFIFSASSYGAAVYERYNYDVTKINGSFYNPTSPYMMQFYMDKTNNTLYLSVPSYSGVSLTDLQFKGDAITYTKVSAIPDTATKITVTEYASIDDTSTGDTQTTWSSSKIASTMPTTCSLTLRSGYSGYITEVYYPTTKVVVYNVNINGTFKGLGNAIATGFKVPSTATSGADVMVSTIGIYGAVNTSTGDAQFTRLLIRSYADPFLDVDIQGGYIINGTITYVTA